MTFAGRAIRVAGAGDPSLMVEEAVKRSIMREFGYDRARVDGIDVDQLLHNQAFLDLGSQVVFSKEMDASGLNLFMTE